jgi:hypothetical protein
MTARRLALFVLALAACDAGSGRHGPGGQGGNPNGTSPSGTLDPNKDSDGDGYSPNMGDCDDTNPLIGPNSVEVNGDGIDNDCDGQIDNAASCDTGVTGQKTADALAKAMGFCWPKFLTASKFNGPSDPVARNTLAKLGVVGPKEGASMAYISSGDASANPGYITDPGADLMNTYPNPYQTLAKPPSNGCGMGFPSAVNDYTELELDLTVPYNANSFSFDSQFFSAEYPVFVCSMFNDRFLVILDDNTGNPQQIEFDMHMNPVSVNNGFFTICQNDNSKPQTQHCTAPVSQIAGSGFGDNMNGGSTGWLTTTAPVTPGDKIKLRFIVFDEGDGILDSSALIDNFQWGTQMVSAPVTVQ